MLEPGQATFKIGNEAAGVRGEIPGGDGDAVLRNELELVFASVGENVVLDNKRSVIFAPTDVKPKVKKLDGNKRIKEMPPVIRGVKKDNMFIDSRDEVFNTTRAKPPGDADDVIDIPAERNPPFPGPDQIPVFGNNGPGKNVKNTFGSG